MIRWLPALCLLFFALPVHSAINLAEVNGTVLTTSDYDAFAAQFRAPPYEKAPVKMRLAVLNSLIKRELLAQAAAKKGLKPPGDDPNQKKNMAANLILKSLSEEPRFQDAALEKQYKKNGMSFHEYEIRHIQLNTKKAATALIKQVGNSKRFAKTALKKSLDISAVRGGYLGWIGPESVESGFFKALSEKKGLVDKPIRTSFGWHLVFIENTRKLSKAPFETIKEAYRQELIRDHIQAFMEDLENKAKIKILAH